MTTLNPSPVRLTAVDSPTQPAKTPELEDLYRGFEQELLVPLWTEIGDLMPLERDFAFVLDRGVPAATLLRAARNADKGLITGVDIFDLFEGAGVGEGKKSVGIRVTLQPTDKTLTDEEIEKVGTSIVAAVGKATGGTLRG